jgi:hypothetical protein
VVSGEPDGSLAEFTLNPVSKEREHEAQPHAPVDSTRPPLCEGASAAVLRSSRGTPHGGDGVREDACVERRAARTCPRRSERRASPPTSGATSPRSDRSSPASVEPPRRRRRSDGFGFEVGAHGGSCAGCPPRRRPKEERRRFERRSLLVSEERGKPLTRFGRRDRGRAGSRTVRGGRNCERSRPLDGARSALGGFFLARTTHREAACGNFSPLLAQSEPRQRRVRRDARGSLRPNAPSATCPRRSGALLPNARPRPCEVAPAAR